MKINWLNQKKEPLPALKVQNRDIMHLKPSQLPLMNQVNMTLNIFVFKLNLYI
jgi:hypothetical protein